MKIQDLTNKQLNYWVAKAQGWRDYPEDSIERGDTWHIEPDKAPFGRIIRKSSYNPSTNWEQCGELIEKYSMDLYQGTEWSAEVLRDGVLYVSYSDTPQRAVCIALLRSVYGDDYE